MDLSFTILLKDPKRKMFRKVGGMEVNVEKGLLNLIASVEKDISKVIPEALHLWLKQRIPICPITENLCINIKGSCNNCQLINEKTTIS